MHGADGGVRYNDPCAAIVAISIQLHLIIIGHPISVCEFGV